jgi:hypothetical protein
MVDAAHSEHRPRRYNSSHQFQSINLPRGAMHIRSIKDRAEQDWGHLDFSADE